MSVNNWLFWLFKQANLLAVVLGFTDGILTALTLAAGRLTSPERHVTLSLAFRIAAGALASGAFVFFVARYSALRRELIHAERQLNLTSRGRLSTSRLGAAILREGAWSGLVSSVASFCGALVPLLAGALLPGYHWASIVAALVTLAVLGLGLARSVHGSVLRWSSALVIGGGALAVIGAYLKIVS